MLPTCFDFTDSLLVYLQVILTANGEGTSHNITWTDPAIPVDGQNNASFYLCDNKFHKIVLRRNFSNVEFQVDGYSLVQAALPPNFALKNATFHIGGVPGKKHKLIHK